MSDAIDSLGHSPHASLPAVDLNVTIWDSLTLYVQRTILNEPLYRVGEKKAVLTRGGKSNTRRKNASAVFATVFGESSLNQRSTNGKSLL